MGKGSGGFNTQLLATNYYRHDYYRHETDFPAEKAV
jgi:hypothetical protein